MIATNLAEIFNQLKTYPNGEIVARRMAELWDFVLAPGNEDLAITVDKLETAIVAQESELLKREGLEVVKSGSLLGQFQSQLKQSSEEEWQTFKAENGISPSKKEEIQAFLSEANSQVRLPQFRQWVLGELKEPRTETIETTISKQIATRLSRKE